MSPLPEAIILVFASFAPLFSPRVWLHAQILLLGAMLTPGARTVTAVLRAMGLAAARHFTNYQCVWNRASGSARQGRQMLLGQLITRLVPSETAIVLGADDTVERRTGRTGQHGRTPMKGKAQRRLQGWAARADTPGETIEVDWYGGQRKQLWGFSRTALWYTPRVPPVGLRYVLACDPEGQLRMEVFCCTDLDATPAQLPQCVVRRWSVEVTCEEARAHLGLETQRPWSDHTIARTTPVRSGPCSRW